VAGSDQEIFGNLEREDLNVPRGFIHFSSVVREGDSGGVIAGVFEIADLRIGTDGTGVPSYERANGRVQWVLCQPL
jgi:hypothetical protein